MSSFGSYNNKRNNFLSYKDIEKFNRRATDNTVKCKCGHSVVITNKYDRVICTWCGNWVYKNKKVEFKYKMLKELKKK